MRKMGLGLGSLLLTGAVLSLVACGGDTKRVYFGNLEDGSNVESPFKVQMKAENLIVEPATMGVVEGHGHFHIIVDGSLASPSEPMAKDEKHIHYGNGQTEATLDLPVGQHTLILQFAKGDHVPYDPPIYQQVQINVTKQNKVDTAAVKAPEAPKADSAAAKVDTAAAKADTTAAAAAKTDSTAAKAKSKPKAGAGAAAKKKK